MSKRLQLLVSDSELKQIKQAAKARQQSVSSLVREGLVYFLSKSRQKKPEERISALLRFARYSGPTGDIEQLLAEIEQGRQ